MRQSILPAIALLALSSVSARADWTVLNRTETVANKEASKTSDITVRVRGDLYRIDAESPRHGATSTIVNVTTGDTIRIMHVAKVFQRVPGDKMRAAMAAAGRMLAERNPANTIPEPPKRPVATGESEKVGQKDAAIYVLDATGGKQKFWVATSMPFVEGYLAAMRRLYKSGLLGADEAGIFELPGLVLKQERWKGEEKVSTMTMIAVKDFNLEDTDFKPAKTYKEVPVE